MSESGRPADCSGRRRADNAPAVSEIFKRSAPAGNHSHVTTNGKKLSWQTVYHLANFAGAVALSIEELGDNFKKRRGFRLRISLKALRN